ncbi:MAG: hypothetical protein SF182_24830, partial [Deltaproteobacteria bacterium]|nr:hypothetical protein [Deltaproteobacteria bacterium]
VSANEAAELLAGAVAGLKGPGVSVDAYRRRVARLITLFVAGLQPAAMARVGGAPRSRGGGQRLVGR